MSQLVAMAQGQFPHLHFEEIQSHHKVQGLALAGQGSLPSV